VYRPTRWQDHVTEFVNRFWETENPDGSICHELDEGEILQEGTPQNAANFNNLESGIFSALQQTAELARKTLQHERALDELKGEAGTVVLTNSRAYPFNNSVVTIPLAVRRNTTDYSVYIVDTTVSGGVDSQIGRIVTFDKLVNGFRIAYTGSAPSVTVRFLVQGGVL